MKIRDFVGNLIETNEKSQDWIPQQIKNYKNLSAIQKDRIKK